MKKLNRYLVLLALSATVGVSAVAADAPEKTAEHHHMGWHKMTPEKMQEYRAKRQAALHDQLKLSSSQEPAWKTYIAAITPLGTGKRWADRAAMEKMTAPERLEKRLQMSRERDARMTARLGAMKTFYATLTPEQQQVFNARKMHGRKHHGHGGNQEPAKA